MNNIEALVEVFDKFIEVGENLVLLQDIKAIKATTESGGGILVIASHDGQLKEYKDKMTFIELKSKILEIQNKKLQDQLAGKSQDIMKDSVQKTLVVTPQTAPQPQQPKVIPLNESPPQPQKRRVNNCKLHLSKLDSSNSSAEGDLPDAPDVIERETIQITSPGGILLGRGHEDGNGTITGPKASGIVNTSGHFRLSFKEYAENIALISYTVRPAQRPQV